MRVFVAQLQRVLTNDLAAFAARLPMKWKLQGRSSKYLLRQLLDRKLKRWPTEVRRDWVSRPKKGFGVPLRDWWRTDLRPLLDDYLSTHRLRSQGVFNADRIEDLIRGHLERGENHAHLLWSLISFQMWAERYGVVGRSMGF